MKETTDTDPDEPVAMSKSTEDHPSTSTTDPGLEAPSGELDGELIDRLVAGLGVRGRRVQSPNLRMDPVIRAETKGDLAAAYHAGPRAAPVSRDTQPGFEAAVIPPPDARHEPTLRLPHAPGKPGGPLSDEPAPGYESESPRLPVRSPLVAWVALAVLILGAIGVFLLSRQPASNEGTAASASSPPTRPSVASARESSPEPIASVLTSPAQTAEPQPSAVHIPAPRKIEPERTAPRVRAPAATASSTPEKTDPGFDLFHSERKSK